MLKIKNATTLLFIACMAVATANTAIAQDYDKEELFALLELNSQNANNLTLQDVITKALDYQKGLVKQARIEFEDGEVKYEIEISDGTNVHYLQIDPKTGEFESKRLDVGKTVFNYITLGMTSLNDSQERLIMANFQKGIQDVKGTIIALEIERSDDLIFFEVKSLLDDKLAITLISGQSGDTVFYKYFPDGSRDSYLSIQSIKNLFG